MKSYFFYCLVSCTFYFAAASLFGESQNLFWPNELFFGDGATDQANLAKNASEFSVNQVIVLKTKKIELPGCGTVFNPSIITFKDHFLLVFRCCPDIFKPWVSLIGCVELDSAFEKISNVQMLNTRLQDMLIESQSEDARIFSCDGKLYVIYNDNVEVTNPSQQERRDMFIAELHHDQGVFALGPPLKLMHTEKYLTHLWEKNWTPFEYQKKLLLAYHINPHEIVVPDLTTGASYPLVSTKASFRWEWGEWRGGTPAKLIDGYYLAFFHSMKKMRSKLTFVPVPHYFMGAYQFSSEPPFELKRASKGPIVGEGFYTKAPGQKRVIYPCGWVASGTVIYLSYGKDDNEVWIATIDKKALYKSLKRVN